MKTKKITKGNIFFVCAIITLSLMILKKSNLIDKMEEVINLRILFDNTYIKYVCDKAGNSLTKKYRGGYDEKDFGTKELNKYQQSLIDFSRDTKYDNIKTYLKRFIIFLIILILDIIFIFFWIGYCCCCCCDCCCFKRAEPPSRFGRKISFFISIICLILVFLFCFILFFIINNFFSRANGIACSTFTFVDHFKDGIKEQYPKVEKKWEGVDEINTLFKKGLNAYEEPLEKLEEKDGCNDIYDSVKKYYDEYNNIKDSTLKKIDLKKQIDDIQGAKNRFDETEEKACKDVYDFFHDRANKHLKKTYLSAIALVFVFSFLGILFLLFYYKCKSNVFRILFVVIWNILMLFMLYCILLGFVFGILAYVLEDGVRVVQYIVSSENLKNQDPLFVKSNSYVSDLIDACANGEGDFLKAINKKDDIDESIKKFDDIKNQNKDIQNELDQSNCTNKAYFQNIYNSLNGRTDQIKGNLTALKDINCAFAKNDKNIILNEMDSGSKKAKGMCALSLLIGFLLGISILTGILFVHKYRFGDTSQEEKIVEVKQNVYNDSGLNFQNNQNTTIPNAF